MKRLKFLVWVFLFVQILFVQFSSGQQNKTTFIKASPNTYAPSLYSEKINLQIILVNLPGADTKGSSFQGTYNMYFIPEGEIEKLAQNRGGSIDELRQNDIPNKILLNSGSFNKSLFNTSRVVEKVGIPFKIKVADKLRTMLGKIVVFYSVKIFDAKLRETVYKDSSFTYFPFERTDNSSPRKTFHISFFVNENSKIYTSSLPRDKTSTTW